MSSASSIEQYESNLVKVEKYIKEFKTYIPYEERSFVAEAELYEKQNQHTEMINALQEGINSVRVAPQCCMKLADAYLELGEYEKVWRNLGFSKDSLGLFYMAMYNFIIS